MSNSMNSDFGFDYTKLHTYSGYYIDDLKLLQSASGGAVSALAEQIIKQGGVVFGAAYSDDFRRSEYRCVDNLNDLKLLKGSKYCETLKEIYDGDKSVSVFKVLEEKIKEDKLILFVGLGCDIGAVKKYCENKQLNMDRLYLVDIICHGPTYIEVHRDFIDYLEKKYKSKITYFSVRYKKDGWKPIYIHGEFENGKIYEVPFYKSEYGFAFNRCSKTSCYECKYKGDKHQSDITCGDFWGIKEDMNGYNHNGVSIMFVRNDKGEELIKMLDRDIFHIQEADTCYALSNNHMYYESTKKDIHYDKFVQDLKEKGLFWAVDHYPYETKVKIKRFIKKIIPKSLLK